MIYNLSDFGLTPRALRRTPERSIAYSIQLRGPRLSRLKRQTPKERNQRLDADLRKSVAALTRTHDFTSFQPRSIRRPWTIDAVSRARTFLAVAGSPLVGSLFVTRVSGARRRKAAREPRLYTIRALVAIQVEGQTRGMQKMEERFVTVRATTEAKARDALRVMWRQYAEPYLNPYGEFVRWQLEEVLEILETWESRFDPAGTEVYSRRYFRRLTPERVWRP
jgi:hypothetical protein